MRAPTKNVAGKDGFGYGSPLQPLPRSVVPLHTLSPRKDRRKDRRSPWVIAGIMETTR